MDSPQASRDQSFSKKVFFASLGIIVVVVIAIIAYTMLKPPSADYFTVDPFSTETKEDPLDETLFVLTEEQEEGQIFDVSNCVATPDTAAAENFLTQLNSYRQSKGLAPVKLSNSLMKSAAWYADDLLRNNAQGHIDSLGRNPVDRARDCGYSQGAIYEAMAGGVGKAPIDIWKESPEHDAVLRKSDMKVIGFGEASGMGNNRWVMVGGTSDDTASVPPPPTNTPVQVQPTATRTPTPTIAITSPTLTPSVSPTIIISPTTTVTITPSLTPTNTQGQVGIKLNLTFDGIGTGGNTSPQPNTKKVKLELFNTNNQKVKDAELDASYTGGVFSVPWFMPALQQGQYYLKVDTINTLQQRAIPELFTLTQAGTNISANPIYGDLNDDNTLDIRDYNIFLNKAIACLLDGDCKDVSLLDFNMDNELTGIDYNILLRSFSEIQGD